MKRPALIAGRIALPCFAIVILSVASLAGQASTRQSGPAPTESAQPMEFYHAFEGQRQPFALDTSRYAVLSDEVAAQTLKVESELPIPGWRLVRFSAEQRAGEVTIESAVAQVNNAAERPDLDFVSPVFIGLDGGPVIVSPTLLIRFDPSIAPEEAERMIAEHFQGEIIERDWANMVGAYRVSADSRNGFTVLDAANALAETPGVLWAEPDMLFTGRGGLIPNDPFFSSTWGVHNTGQSGGLVDFDMDCPEAWDVTIGDPSIIVVILDTGVDPTHPDINQITGEDFTNDIDLNGAPVNVCDSHGTAVAGCVSGIINNGIGGVGAAPGCVIASARPFSSNVPCDGTWSSFASWTVNALAWAEAIGARVTNNSNGYGFTSASIANKYLETRNNGMVHFAAAGNGGSPIIGYPASLPTVNSVTALNRFGERATFSDYGVGTAFSAPGESIVTTDRQGGLGYTGGDYATVNGTSFASPYVAGVAALILSVDPSLTAAEVEQALINGATDLGNPGYDTDYGWGLVNARASIDRSPAAFEITTPSCDGALALPMFEWNASLFADEYTIEISTDPLFNSIEYAQAGITSTGHIVPLSVLPPCEIYYARITASNAFGQTIATVDPCPFTMTLSADLNDDGVVDTADLGGLVGSFGSSGSFGDINGDGVVDTADLGLLLGQFGADCGAV